MYDLANTSGAYAPYESCSQLLKSRMDGWIWHGGLGWERYTGVTCVHSVTKSISQHPSTGFDSVKDNIHTRNYWSARKCWAYNSFLDSQPKRSVNVWVCRLTRVSHGPPSLIIFKIILWSLDDWISCVGRDGKYVEGYTWLVVLHVGNHTSNGETNPQMKDPSAVRGSKTRKR